MSQTIPSVVVAELTYGDLHADLEGRGQPIGPLDAIVAAHAFSLNAALETNNTRELSRGKGWQLENSAEYCFASSSSKCNFD